VQNIAAQTGASIPENEGLQVFGIGGFNRLRRTDMNVATKIVCIALIASLPIITAAQNQPLKFEVVSVRACKAGEPHGGLQPAPGGQRYIAKCVPLRPIIWTSYWLPPSQVLGGPSWIDTDDFYIEGVAERPSTIPELHVMMQNAIAERFSLQSHRETKEVQGYVLGVDKSGAKNFSEHSPTNGGDVIISVSQIGQGLQEKWTAKSAPMDFFLWRLAMKLRSPVIDQTALRGGGYDFELSFTNELPPSPLGALPPNVDTSGPTIFQAVRQQLGLTLTDRKVPAEILVIDHAEKPREN
jgi:uncharacterized protein (TIGR03435 family)